MERVPSSEHPRQRAGRLNLLTPLFGDVWVPPAVVREATFAGVALAGEPSFRVQALTNPNLVRRLHSTLNAGESETSTLVIELDAEYRIRTYRHDCITQAGVR